jgi:hypothetical protein
MVVSFGFKSVGMFLQLRITEMGDQSQSAFHKQALGSVIQESLLVVEGALLACY